MNKPVPGGFIYLSSKHHCRYCLILGIQSTETTSQSQSFAFAIHQSVIESRLNDTIIENVLQEYLSVLDSIWSNLN